MAAARRTNTAAAEADAVTPKPKPTRARASKAAASTRAPRKEPAKRARSQAPGTSGPAAPPPISEESPRLRRRGWTLSAALAVGAALLASAATFAFVSLRDEETPPPGAAGPTSVGQGELAAFASSAGRVYWAGPRSGHTLELTSTRSGTFVRYLPAGVAVGDPRPAFTTVATYPLEDAYATVVGRRSLAGVVSLRTPGGGLAVWRRAQPTSVYLAFRGVPYLIEVYAASADRARNLVRSGQIAPVG